MEVVLRVLPEEVDVDSRGSHVTQGGVQVRERMTSHRHGRTYIHGRITTIALQQIYREVIVNRAIRRRDIDTSLVYLLTNCLIADSKNEQKQKK